MALPIVVECTVTYRYAFVDGDLIDRENEALSMFDEDLTALVINRDHFGYSTIPEAASTTVVVGGDAMSIYDAETLEEFKESIGYEEEIDGSLDS